MSGRLYGGGLRADSRWTFRLDPGFVPSNPRPDVLTLDVANDVATLTPTDPLAFEPIDITIWIEGPPQDGESAP